LSSSAFGAVIGLNRLQVLNDRGNVARSEFKLRHRRMADANAFSQRLFKRVDAVVARQLPERRRLGRRTLTRSANGVTA
jgi:hypothetical protein